MSKAQKIIKYLAFAFALFLAFSIISSIIYGLSFVGDMFDNDKQSSNLKELKINNNALVLDINVSSSNINIKQGNTLKVETNNKYIYTNQYKNKLYIKEKKHNLFNKNDDNKLTVYVPKSFVFDLVNIEVGASKLNISSLTTKKLSLNLGAGKVEIDNLNVANSADIEGGAGEIVIEDSNITNLDLDMGAGKLLLNSKLTGNSKIEAGVGKMDLLLIGSLNDYSITLDKGIGSVTINNSNMENDKTYGMGTNKIDIDGGVGSINIDFIIKR